ncbi:YgaP family membrane protein [Eudoraea sp.]|uniref:YgaP family membrane protein n=1 Tax=Eudoraea sp. TaxID=1979955 RepID=UPI003C72F347
MKRNMGRIDKFVRVSLAVIAALLVYFNVVQGTLAYVLLAVAAVFVLTSLISFCPLYGHFGLNTCKVKKT